MAVSAAMAAMAAVVSVAVAVFQIKFYNQKNRKKK